MAQERSGGVLVAIGVFKIVKVVLLLIAGFAALELLHRDPQAVAWQWIERFNVDPTRPIVQKILGKSGGLEGRKLYEVIITSFTYAVLLGIEGTGLLLRKHWAEWATVFITGSLLPFEVYELHQRFSATRVAVLIVNALIVVYLIARLVKHHREQKGQQSPARRELAHA